MSEKIPDWLFTRRPTPDGGEVSCGMVGVYFMQKGLPSVTIYWADLGAQNPDESLWLRAVAGEFKDMVRDRRYAILLEMEKT